MKKYWRSIEESKDLETTGKIEKKEPLPEFSIEGLDKNEIQGKSGRRDFLKMLGFTVGYATLAAGCEMPVRKAIPYLNQPEEITPGVANFYASTFYDGNDYCSILVKTREGRPIKIEGNKLSPISKGGTSARVQASVLNLYDTARLQGPMKNGNKTNWETIDAEITDKLQSNIDNETEIALVTSTIISPTTKNLINEFIEKHPSVKWITYDSISLEAIRKANKVSFDREIIPSYHFENADLIVGFNVDFLGTWLSPVEFTKQYSSRRLLDGDTKMSRHIQYETNLSLTGSNADKRVPIKPSHEGLILLTLYNLLAKSLGAPVYPVASSPIDVSGVAKELLNSRGKSLVVSGSNDTSIQTTVNAINNLLGNYGKTIDMNRPVYLKQGNDLAFSSLIERMNAGKVDGIILWNVNPAYDYPEADKFVNGLEKVDFSVSFAETMDETASYVTYVCPDNHYLESWGDAEPQKGYFSMAQPTIPKLFNTRQTQENLLKWSGNDSEYYTYLKKYWEENIFPLQTNFLTFNEFWNQTVHDGTLQLKTDDVDQPDFLETSLTSPTSSSGDGLELMLYEKISLGTGKYANNPWLQELPDPISKATWDNYICLSPKYAGEYGLENEDMVSVNGKFDVPVLVQVGQAYGTCSIAVGYGRTRAGKVADNLGVNAFSLISSTNGLSNFSGIIVSISKVPGKKHQFALTQVHHSMEGRAIVRESTLNEYKKDPAAGNKMHMGFIKQNASLYQQPEFNGFRWGLAINLNACIGCGNCVISCQAENNISVIGKDQVRNRRIMHWMRIDRYYSEDSENPEVVHQPVMCQHCDNAPCENVCPVAATPHSNEGLNQMIYNRCIGTRYCMNNCPYRVRRFNWFEMVNNDEFDYNMNSDLGKMVLNPDVTVRSRGVVEKCSLCVQRIQEKKLQAKKENRQLEDGEIKMACEQSCPADAIVFGNMLDPESRVSKIIDKPGTYQLLEYLHTLPSVNYLTKIRNIEEVDS